MKRHLVIAAAGLALAGCASTATQFSDLGAGAYAMTKRSGLAAQRAAELKSQLELEALRFCSERGQALTMLDTRAVDPDLPDYSFATIQFRCVPR